MAQKKIFEFARSITESDKNDQASIYLEISLKNVPVESPVFWIKIDIEN